MRKYVILDADEVPDILFSEVLETSAQTLRRSIDEAFCVLKYEGDRPSFLEGKTQALIQQGFYLRGQVMEY